jgi:small-conductance mechanosensitive channel
MEGFFYSNSKELLTTLIVVIVIGLLRFVAQKAIRRIGKINSFVEGRTLLISKYISILLTFLGIAVLTIVWGVNFTEVALLFSSLFAVLGVAFVAQWSIISNITAGVVLFFSVPFKIGDKIKIMDKEIMEESEQIEDSGVFTIENITAFHVHLRKPNGVLITYPNNLMLQKGIALVQTYEGGH